MKELAVIIPVYNGGSRLLESVQSCARSGMQAERYRILVIDNCSTDGSIEELPEVDGNAVPIKVWRNEKNLGRTGNWNRALEIATREGFHFATFLFVGDTWVHSPALEDLLNLMRENAATLGMAPLLIASEDGRKLREGARISFPGDRILVDSRELVRTVIGTGRLPFAPLQANVYRLYSESPLRFDTDPASALNTDMESTVSYLMDHPGKVALISRPFLVWKEDSRRFFATQDPWFVMVETRASLTRISTATGLPVDWASANAISLLMAAYELSRRLTPVRRLAFLWRVFRYLKSEPGGLRIGKFLAFTIKKILWNKSYLSLSHAGATAPASQSSASSGSAPAISRYGS